MNGGPVGGVTAVSDDARLVGRLRDGDERAFEKLVTALYPAMVAVARGYVRDRPVVDEVVQEAWLAVLNGLDRFEGRSSLRTWVLRIVANIAHDRGAREARSLPFSSLDRAEDEPAVPPERFQRSDQPFPGGWRSFPTDWQSLPEPRLLSRETLDHVARAIASLPDSQRLVMTLRDVTGCSAEEVCEVLGLSAGNERVLLHRGRARVRAELERYLDG